MGDDLASLLVHRLLYNDQVSMDDLTDAAREVLESKADHLDLTQDDVISTVLSHARQQHDGDVMIDADELKLDDVTVSKDSCNELWPAC